MSELFTDTKEYLITGINECVSVFSSAPPALHSDQFPGLKGTAMTQYPPQVALEQAMIRALEGGEGKSLPIADFEILRADTWVAVWVFFVTEQDAREHAEAGALIGVERDFRAWLLALQEQFSFGELPSISFELDSKENVDKNYQGSYYLRMR